MDVMKHVDILELVKIDVYRPNIYKPGEIAVKLIPFDKSKQVVVDPDELRQLEEKITEKCQQFDDARDPRVGKYIEEFVGRICSDWHRMGLLLLEDIPDAPEDPYAEAKKNVKS